MNETAKETKFVVTEEEYRKDLKKGWTDDETLKPGEYIARRSRFINNSNNSKTKITMNVDADILEHFRQLSGQTGAGYQTLMNRALRDAMKGKDLTTEKDTVNDFEKLLEDKKFLKKLKSKLKAV